MKHFVVVATARSGTKYTASVLTELGWKCGHEAIFRPRMSQFAGFGRLNGDSSWLAVPFIGQLPPDTVILHQVRDPLGTIRSMASRRTLKRWYATEVLRKSARRLWRRRDPRNHYRRFTKIHSPQAWSERTTFARAARHWVEWNMLIEQSAKGRPYIRYRLEDIDHDLIQRLAQLLGAEVPAGFQLPRDPANVRQRQFDEHELSDLSVELQDAVRGLAARYGYELDRHPTATG